MNRPYTFIRSNRKTLALSVTGDLEIVVRAPARMARRDIERFLAQHEDWIEAHLEKQRCRALAHPEPTEAEAEALRRQAKAYLPGRVAYFARIMGVTPTGFRVTSAKTRHGSCSGKNSLCFSFRLMAYPAEAIDYVVVHELAHIIHKDHGKAFYQMIERTMPDYKARRALLKM